MRFSCRLKRPPHTRRSLRLNIRRLMHRLWARWHRHCKSGAPMYSFRIVRTAFATKRRATSSLAQTRVLASWWYPVACPPRHLFVKLKRPPSEVRVARPPHAVAAALPNSLFHEVSANFPGSRVKPDCLGTYLQQPRIAIPAKKVLDLTSSCQPPNFKDINIGLRLVWQ